MPNKYDDVDEEDGDLIGGLEHRLKEAFKMNTEDAELNRFSFAEIVGDHHNTKYMSRATSECT